MNREVKQMSSSISPQTPEPVSIPILALVFPLSGSLWLHSKTKRIYKVLGPVFIEKTQELSVAYRSSDNDLDSIWVRPLVEWRQTDLETGIARFKPIYDFD